MDAFYFRVRNWHEFQHYHGGKRGITWIKNYLELDDPSHPFSKLPFADQGRLQAIWRLAAKLDNMIPLDEKFVARAINAKRVPLGDYLAANWLQAGTQEELKKLSSAEKRAANRKNRASKRLAGGYPFSSLEKEREKEPPSPPSGKKNHVCDVCGIGFRTLSYLEDHRFNVHGIERPSALRVVA